MKLANKKYYKQGRRQRGQASTLCAWPVGKLSVRQMRKLLWSIFRPLSQEIWGYLFQKSLLKCFQVFQNSGDLQ